MIERLPQRRDLVGGLELTACFRCSARPFEDAEASTRTFAAEVPRVLQAEMVGI